ncbi:MAG: class I SAM-dependent methyltransferase [Butyrivibrio sp.]|nr:class I SAM-dependent methyltransferase [Butyrivibrio sp.]
MEANQHYDKEYFTWQKKVGEFGGKANLFKFESYIERNMDVLDFGCGGGFLLKQIETDGKKIGVEINPSAREEAEGKGILCYEQISNIDDNSVDIVVSNHALEHVENPFYYITEFKRVVKTGGKMVLVVPHEMSRTIKDEDRHKHLYTWTPQNMYNLCKLCGWEVESCESLCNAWMPYYYKIQRVVGWKIFNLLCYLYGKLRRRYQTRVVCIKR